MATYACHFDFSAYNSRYTNMRVDSDGGPGDFMNGFWLDKSLTLCKTTEVKYWIPPSQILYVEKVSE